MSDVLCCVHVYMYTSGAVAHSLAHPLTDTDTVGACTALARGEGKTEWDCVHTRVACMWTCGLPGVATGQADRELMWADRELMCTWCIYVVHHWKIDFR